MATAEGTSLVGGSGGILPPPPPKFSNLKGLNCYFQYLL